MQASRIKTYVSQVFTELTFKKFSLLIAILLFLQVLYFEKLSKIAFFEQVSIRAILIGLTGFLFFYIAAVENHVLKLKTKICLCVGTTCFFVLLFFIWAHNYREPFLIAQIPLVLAVTLFFYKSLLWNDDSHSRSWQNSFYKTVLESLIAGVLFIISVELVVFLTKFVFEVEATNGFHEFLFKFGGILIPCIVFLGRISAPREVLNKFSENLIRYVFVPLWAIYVSFLSIYTIKILIHWSLPKGMVAIPVSIAFFVFSLIWWARTPLKTTGKTNFISPKVEQAIRWLQPILLVLFWIAVIRRFSDYGMTQPRYYLVLLGLFFLEIVVLDLTRKLTGRWFSSLLIIFTLLSIFKIPI